MDTRYIQKVTYNGGCQIKKKIVETKCNNRDLLYGVKR